MVSGRIQAEGLQPKSVDNEAAVVGSLIDETLCVALGISSASFIADLGSINLGLSPRVDASLVFLAVLVGRRAIASRGGLNLTSLKDEHG